ncbi:MAG: EAL domain-containing protein [Thiotrichales bacterium]
MHRGENLSLLLVDDDADLRAYWSAQFEREFARVSASASAREALEFVHRETPDIVLANLQLRDSDGFALCAELRAHAALKSTAVILYKAGYIASIDRQRAEQVAADQLLQRSSPFHEIVTAIKEVHAEKRAQHLIEAEGYTLLEEFGDDTQEELIRRKLLEQVRQLHKEREAFRRALSRYRDFAQGAADFFWETDAKQRLRFVAAAPNNPLGLPRELTVVQTLPQFLDGKVPADELEMLVRALETEEALELTLRLNLGEERIVRLVAQPFYTTEGRLLGYRGSLADITEIQLRSEQLQYEAHHDVLTGLFNRRAFEGLLDASIKDLRDGEFHVLCMMDLDYFKTVNDTFGHRAGDELLIQLAQLFRRKVRSNDMLARVGGDEFAALMKHCSIDQARRLIQDLHHSVKTFQFAWEGRTFEIGVSFGLVEVAHSALTGRELMDFADQACYAAKRAGKNQIQIFGGGNAEDGELRGDAYWLERFHHAVQNGRLHLFRQPIKHSRGVASNVFAYEMLVRLDDGERLISPKEFLPVLERYRLAQVLDRWVLDKVVHWLGSRANRDGWTEEFYSINLSSHSLGDADFRGYIQHRLQQNPEIAARLCIEVTESTAIENVANAIDFIQSLRKIGVRFALDDFGTGFSSLAYLKSLPVDFLKLDGMFVMGINADPVDFGLLRTIQELAQVLKIKTIAEYVESAEVAARLREIGVDYMQGHFIGHPEQVMVEPETPRVAALRA